MFSLQKTFNKLFLQLLLLVVGYSTYALDATSSYLVISNGTSVTMSASDSGTLNDAPASAYDVVGEHTGGLLVHSNCAANCVITRFSFTHLNGNGTNSNSTNAGGTYTYGNFNITINADGSYTMDASEWTNISKLTFLITASDDDTTNVQSGLTIWTKNAAPVGVNDTGTVNEDATVTVNVLEDDTDVESDSLTVSAIRTGSTEGSGTAGTLGSALTATYGQLTMNANGSCSYAANQSAADDLDAGDTVTDAFNYTVSDGTATDIATLIFTITGVNNVPVAVNDTDAVNEDGTVTVNDGEDEDVLKDDTDADDSASLTVTAIRTGSTEGSGTAGTLGSALTGTYGQLTMNANGSYTYIANQSAADDLDAGDTVTDAFNYTVSDGTATDIATLIFTITGLNNDNLPSPLDKKDVIGSIEAWSNISSEWLKFSIDNAFNRIDWLNRQRGSNQTSHQGIKLSFVNTLTDKIMNNSPGAALSDIDVVDTTASLIGSTNATLDEVSDNAESKANDIAINEAARLREGLVGSINPSFGPVIGNWSVWTEGKIVIGKTDASTTASKQEIEVQSISLGFDKPLGDDELMGFVLSIGQHNNDIGTASTNVKSNNYSLSNYNVIKLNNNTKIESVFGVGHLEFNTLRSDGSDTLLGKRKAKQLFLSTTFKPEDTRYVGNWKVSPYSKVLLANTRLNSFSESGGATALTFNKQYVKDAGLSVGMDINSSVTVNNATINPYAKIEYARSSSKTSASMHYNNEDASTNTYSANLNKQIKNWKLKLGLDLNTESGWNSSVSLTREQPFGSGQASKYSNSFSFNAGTRF